MSVDSHVNLKNSGLQAARFLAAVRWTPLSRQKRVEFKRVTDQPAAEWRCPNFNVP